MNATLSLPRFPLLFAALLAPFVLSQCGCTTDPATGDVTVRVPAAAVDAATNAAARAVIAIREAHERGESGAPASMPEREPAPAAGTVPEQFESPDGEAPPSPTLVFRFGGFDGSKAKEEPGCRIGSLRMDRDGMSYKWLSGGCEALGASDRGDYSKTLACAFFWDGSRWIGGKFDWISTSRTSRSFENIHDGYGGWDASAFFSAKKRGFCIVSADGRKRSNFVEAE